MARNNRITKQRVRTRNVQASARAHAHALNRKSQHFSFGRSRGRGAAVRVRGDQHAQSSLSRAWGERMLPEIRFFFTLLIAVYLFISLSGETTGWTSTFDATPVQNLGGRFGAMVADFLYDLIGRLAAWLMPLLLIGRAWHMFLIRHTRRASGLARRLFVFICFVIALVSVSVIENLRAHNIGAEAGHLGGIAGNSVSRVLQPWLTVPGSSATYLLGLAAMVLFLLAITVLIRPPWLRLIDVIGAGFWYALYRLLSLRYALRRGHFSQHATLGQTKSEVGEVHHVFEHNTAATTVHENASAKPSHLHREQDVHGTMQNDNAHPQVLSSWPVRLLQMFMSHTVASHLTGRRNVLHWLQQCFSSSETNHRHNKLARIEPTMDTLSNAQGNHQQVAMLVPTTKARAWCSSAKAHVLPHINLLDQSPTVKPGASDAELQDKSQRLEARLAEFNIVAQVVGVHPGPVITSFEIQPAPGIKVSQITSLSRDLARALSVVSLRVVEIIPGKTVIGIEIPNQERELVSLYDGLASRCYAESPSPLTLMLGQDISGQPVVSDLANMPHLLVAGTTGSGKSVCINALILSILYKSPPSMVRLILVDPKLLELSVYDDIPHLLTPVVTDIKQAAHALRWSIAEMERRYRTMAALGVRNITNYNIKVSQAIASGTPLHDPLTHVDQEQPALLEILPYIVIVIDELADLVMVAGKKMEELITRIAQRARAAGIHLILATQRPSVDVVTGLIKANVPARIAFQVAARVDSRTVLDRMGAEQLLGCGDMLFLSGSNSIPRRVHGSFVSDQEVHRVVEFLKTQGSPVFDQSIVEPKTDLATNHASGASISFGDSDGEQDALYDQAVRVITETRRPTISLVQRHLRIGYNRAARLLETMEKAGVVGPLQNNGKREVLVPPLVEDSPS